MLSISHVPVGHLYVLFGEMEKGFLLIFFFFDWVEQPKLFVAKCLVPCDPAQCTFLLSCFVLSSPYPFHRYPSQCRLLWAFSYLAGKSYLGFKTRLSTTSHEARVDQRDRISSYFCAPAALDLFLFCLVIFMPLFIRLFTHGLIILGIHQVIILGEHWLCAIASLNAKDMPRKRQGKRLQARI